MGAVAFKSTGRRHRRGGAPSAAWRWFTLLQQLIQAYVAVQLQLHQRLYAALTLSKCYTFSMYEGAVGGTCGCSDNPVKSSFFSFGVRMNCTDRTVSIAELKAERMAGISWL